MEMGAIICDYF